MTNNKRNYHPLIIPMFNHNLLPNEYLNEIPKRTKQNWKRINDSDYYGFEWVEDILTDLTDIQTTFKMKQNYSATRFLNEIKCCFKNIIGDRLSNKKELRKHAESIIDSIDRIKENNWITDIKSICWLYGITPEWYYKQKTKLKCKSSPIGSCIKQNPNQLTLDEVSYIEQIMNDPQNYGRSIVTLHYETMRKGLLYCGRSTFYKYANLLGYKKILKYKPKSKKGFRAKKAFEYLHVDVTFVYTEISGIQKVAFVKDNYSKAILHYKSIKGSVNSSFIKDLLSETFDKYNLYQTAKTVNVVSDGGSENKGAVLNWISGLKLPPCVQKLTAHTPEFPHSNNMSESTHHIYKNVFMKRKLSFDDKQHIKDIERFIFDYNYNRFPVELGSYSPMEVLHGKIPEKNRFKQEIEQAKKDRIKANQNYNKCQATMGFYPNKTTFC